MNPVKYVVLLVAVVLPNFSFAQNPPLRQIDAFKVITIEGEDLPSSLGLPIEELSLAAMLDGVMEPIPFQIDEYNEGGAVYFENWEVPMAGTAKQMDPTDKLLFLFKDAGERKTERDQYDGQILAEIVTRERC